MSSTPAFVPMPMPTTGVMTGKDLLFLETLGEDVVGESGRRTPELRQGDDGDDKQVTLRCVVAVTR